MTYLTQHLYPILIIISDLLKNNLTQMILELTNLG
jgi:hypothetical protein